MLRVLIDWLIDVSVSFSLQFDTSHLAILYIRRFLSITKMKIDKSNLQLLGVAALKVADSFNEKSREYYMQTNSIEYSDITDNEFSPK